jgi:hypothetical protein
MSGRKYVRLNNILLKRSDTIVACVLLSKLAPRYSREFERAPDASPAAKTQEHEIHRPSEVAIRYSIPMGRTICKRNENNPYVCVIGGDLLLRRRWAFGSILVEIPYFISSRFAAEGSCVWSRHRAESELRDVILLHRVLVVLIGHGRVGGSGETRGVVLDLSLNCAVESRQNACKKQFSREGTLLKYFEDCPSLPN